MKRLLRAYSNIVFVSKMPKCWKKEDYLKSFSTIGPIQSVQIVFDSLGMPTGKGIYIISNY